MTDDKRIECPICGIAVPIDQTPAVCEECSNISLDVVHDLVEFFGFPDISALNLEFDYSDAGKGRLTEDLRELIKKRRTG